MAFRALRSHTKQRKYVRYDTIWGEDQLLLLSGKRKNVEMFVRFSFAEKKLWNKPGKCTEPAIQAWKPFSSKWEWVKALGKVFESSFEVMFLHVRNSVDSTGFSPQVLKVFWNRGNSKETTFFPGNFLSHFKLEGLHISWWSHRYTH